MMAMIVMITQAWSALVVNCQLPAEARNGQGKGVIMQIQKMNETLKSQ